MVLTLECEVLVEEVEDPQLGHSVVTVLQALSQVHHKEGPEGLDMGGECLTCGNKILHKQTNKTHTQMHKVINILQKDNNDPKYVLEC